MSVPRLRSPSVIAITGLVCACDPQPSMTSDTDGAPARTPLIDHTKWTEVDVADDPLAEHRPAEISCESFWEEDGMLEVATSGCNYAGFVQTTQLDLSSGDRLETIFIHDALYSDADPAAAHAALILDGDIIWETYIEIPTEPAYFDLELRVDRDIPAGAPVVLHLHNHGSNQYRWLPLMRIRE